MNSQAQHSLNKRDIDRFLDAVVRTVESRNLLELTAVVCSRNYKDWLLEVKGILHGVDVSS
jgi:hypothetical protein